MEKDSKKMQILVDFVGATSGSPSRKTFGVMPVVGQRYLALLIKTDVDVVLTIHEGINETAAPTISNSTSQITINVLSGKAAKVIEEISGKWIIIDVESVSGNANIEIFATARS